MKFSGYTLNLALALLLVSKAGLHATPANKAAMERYYERFEVKALKSCTTCHLPSETKEPKDLDEFPHNPFGDRLRGLGEALENDGKSKDLASRLIAVAREDADGDGVPNEDEILLGTNPGDARDRPTTELLAQLPAKRAEFQRFVASYRWRPFERVQRPAVPKVENPDWVRTPIDAFIAAEQKERGLTPRPAASKDVLLRRVYLDLIGLSPTPEEQQAFEDDAASDAYEKVVDRLLNDPRYGERWGRHWMDVWRYSDWAGWTDGKQVRDSQRHIWRWRDWIVESLNQDKGYDQMVVQMLAADEISPDDPNALRATGFLVRNYKMLSREQWLEDTVKHTSQAFLGVTLGCAKCHDHRTDPITQAEYYQVRAIFEPHQVRIDRVPGELDIEKNGLPRVYDADPVPPTYFFIRGDERKPDKDRPMSPLVPRALCGDKLKPKLEITPVSLTKDAAFPDKREFVMKDTIAASEQALAAARRALEKAKAEAEAKPAQYKERELECAIAEAKHAAVVAVIHVEEVEDRAGKGTDEWKQAAREAGTRQRAQALAEAQLAHYKTTAALADVQRQLDEASKSGAADADLNSEPAKARKAVEKASKDIEAATKKSEETEKALAKADEAAKKEPTTEFKARSTETFPATSTGRRLAFAKWIANADNPLTARVAMNHLWLRHFGRGIVATPEDLGASGARPSHPALLDWLAAEFMASGWKMKTLHRMLVTSSTYRMASTPDEADQKIDPDNVALWRMPSRRMESELVRDNILYIGGSLDLTMGGPDIDNAQGLTSKRRSIYLRTAAEKEVEFLKIFDGPSVNECYQRRPSVMPQQALALANSELPIAQAKLLLAKLDAAAREDDTVFINTAFRCVLARMPTADETKLCLDFLQGSSLAANSNEPAQAIAVSNPAPTGGPNPRSHARENLIRVLFNHSDFLTIR